MNFGAIRPSFADALGGATECRRMESQVDCLVWLR